MYTTVNEQGILNNYTSEPPTYYAEYPNQEQQVRYAFFGGVATLLITTLVLIALGVS